MSRVPKRIYCFRLMSVAGQLVEISETLIDISDALTIAQTEIQLFEDVIRIQRFRDSPTGRLYHLTLYSPGTFNSTLTPKAAGGSTTKEVSAPRLAKSSKLVRTTEQSAAVDVNPAIAFGPPLPCTAPLFPKVLFSQ